MMESLFRLTELESRIAVEHERAGRRRRAARRVAGEALSNGSIIAATCWCAARGTACGEIERRLEVLAGMIIVFLNLDEVIRIIREEDEPKDELMRALRRFPKCRRTTSSTRGCAPCAGSKRCSCAASMTS